MITDAEWKIILKQTREDGDCLIWTGPTFGTNGFGVCKVGDRKTLVHRAAYERYAEHPAPYNRLVGQECGNKGCLSEEHIFLGERARP